LLKVSGGGERSQFAGFILQITIWKLLDTLGSVSSTFQEELLAENIYRSQFTIFLQPGSGDILLSRTSFAYGDNSQ